MDKQEKQLSLLKGKKDGFLAQVQETVIDSFMTLTSAVDLTKHIKKLYKEFEDHRKKRVKPIKDSIKIIEGDYKPFTTALLEAEDVLKGKIETYQLKKEEERLKEENRLQEKQQKQHEKAVEKAEDKGVVPPAPPAPVHVETEGKVEGLQMRKIWTFQIEDEMKIPKEYMIADTKKIGKVVKAGIREIPGVRIYEDSSSAISTADKGEDI